eukprot:5369589-Pleurochrysis_carterae.AAC.1
MSLRETARQRGMPSVPAATSTTVLPASALRTRVVGSSTPTTTAASVATGTFVLAAVSAAVASSPMFHATSPGDDRTSWPPEPTRAPPPPPPELHELRCALHAIREEEGLEPTAREYTRKPVRDPVVQHDSRSSAPSRPAQLGTKPGCEATVASVAVVHTVMEILVART